MGRTYLENCLKNGVLCRWPDAAMPIHVYIAPFTWYESKKQQQATMYRQMVLDAMAVWRKASGDRVRFQLSTDLHHSQIDLKWRRVDRKTLGHCEYDIDKSHRLFSAQIQIGISDGLLHAAYDSSNEVQHTILHEIGHALGLIGHSDQAEDIMYVPHQYGVFQLSARDAETLQWLYRLPVGFNYKAVAAKYQLKPGFCLDDVLAKIEARRHGENPDPASPPPAPDVTGPHAAPRKSTVLHATSLEEQHQILSEMGRFYLKTQTLRQNAQTQKQLRQSLSEPLRPRKPKPDTPPEPKT